MEAVELKLVIHYAKDLKDVKVFGSMDPYVVVWIDGYREDSKKVATPTAVNGKCYPNWNYTIRFQIAPLESVRSLFIKIKHEGMLFDRHIGQVEVPFADLSQHASTRKVSYQLTRPSGKKKGEITFSYEFSKLVLVNYGSGISNITNPLERKKRYKALNLVKKVAKGGFKGVPFVMGMFGFSTPNPITPIVRALADDDALSSAILY